MKRSIRALAVCITPFARDGRLDLEGFQAHLGRLVDAGLSVCIGGSGTEEGFSLTADERRELIETAVTCVAGRAEVRLNIREPRTLRGALEEVTLAEELGCDGIHVPILDVGHGYKPSDRELRQYLMAVCAATSKPITISSSYAMGQLMPIPLLREATLEWGVRGVVCGTPDVAYIGTMLRELPFEADVYVAGVSQLLNALTMGGAGFLSPDANVAPEICAGIVRSWEQEDYGNLLGQVGILVRLSMLTVTHGPSTTIKALLRSLGLLATYVRPPRSDVDPAVEADLGAEARRILSLNAQ